MSLLDDLNHTYRQIQDEKAESERRRNEAEERELQKEAEKVFTRITENVIVTMHEQLRTIENNRLEVQMILKIKSDAQNNVSPAPFAALPVWENFREALRAQGFFSSRPISSFAVSVPAVREQLLSWLADWARKEGLQMQTKYDEKFAFDMLTFTASLTGQSENIRDVSNEPI